MRLGATVAAGYPTRATGIDFTAFLYVAIAGLLVGAVVAWFAARRS